MSLIRGDVYVWSDGEHWFIWADHEDSAEDSGWAEGREHPRGVALTMGQMADVVNRYVTKYGTGVPPWGEKHSTRLCG